MQIRSDYPALFDIADQEIAFGALDIFKISLWMSSILTRSPGYDGTLHRKQYSFVKGYLKDIIPRSIVLWLHRQILIDPSYTKATSTSPRIDRIRCFRIETSLRDVSFYSFPVAFVFHQRKRINSREWRKQKCLSILHAGEWKRAHWIREIVCWNNSTFILRLPVEQRSFQRDSHFSIAPDETRGDLRKVTWRHCLLGMNR